MPNKWSMGLFIKHFTTSLVITDELTWVGVRLYCSAGLTAMTTLASPHFLCDHRNSPWWSHFFSHLLSHSLCGHSLRNSPFLFDWDGGMKSHFPYMIIVPLIMDSWITGISRNCEQRGASVDRYPYVNGPKGRTTFPSRKAHPWKQKLMGNIYIKKDVAWRGTKFLWL